MERHTRTYVRASYARAASGVRKLTGYQVARERRLIYLRMLRIRVRRGERLDPATIQDMTVGEVAFVKGMGSDFWIPRHMNIKQEN